MKTDTQIKIEAIQKHYGYTIRQLADLLEMPYATAHRLSSGKNRKPRIKRYAERIDQVYSEIK